jgi:hypothetical protein
MFRFTQSSTARAALAAVAVALFASQTALAAQPKDISYWADAQTASRAASHEDGAQVASQAGDRRDGAQVASQAGDRRDGVGAEYASRAANDGQGVA